MSRTFEAVPVDQHRCDAHSDRVEKLLRLYGPDVFPDDLRQFINQGFGEPKCGVTDPASADVAIMRSSLYLALQKGIFQVQERPVITRFWLFSSCVRVLLLMKIFDLPTEIFSAPRSSAALT